MILLPAPYGYRQYGHHISLRCESRNFVDRIVIGILKSYSCYPSAIPKIISSLHHGGRYDCVLAGSWFREQWPFVKRDLGEHGIELIILEECAEIPLKDEKDCHDSDRQIQFRQKIKNSI